MKRLNVNLGSPNGPLQEAPEVLKAVGMNLALGICFGVVNDCVDVVGFQSSIGLEGIGKDFASRDNILTNFGSKGLAPDIGTTSVRTLL